MVTIAVGGDCEERPDSFLFCGAKVDQSGSSLRTVDSLCIKFCRPASYSKEIPSVGYAEVYEGAILYERPHANLAGKHIAPLKVE